ncbi:type IV secretory system conjugative DNA transfer family protein [Epibacterium ulvae]|uniref:type IV secretory system conjugative DNA transfer family protein n=1 Tax=Epibacterium ulvae TaxID=1156985 RepID=UPI00249148B3|nr:type IV secretory system conjugative DNA transfer family protein [Epibacterium ulvae]
MNAQNDTRFGSARWASGAEIARAGLFRQRPNSIFCGYYGGKALWYDGAAGVTITAGARSGKLAQFSAANGFYGVLPKASTIDLDIKGEKAHITQNQTPDDKHCHYWCPAGSGNLPESRINPVGHLSIDNPNLVADVMTFAANICPRTSNPQGAFFESRAQQFISGVSLALVKKYGVLTLPDLYDAVNLIPGGGEAWIDFAYEMHSSGFDLAYSCEEEIAASREDSSGGFKGIIGEMLKSVGALADPQLRASLSPPYDFDLKDLCRHDQFTRLFLIPPPESLQLWSPILKTFFVGAMNEKARRPNAPRQVWTIDEAGQLGAFPLLIKHYTLGAGLGITPISIFQASKQMDALGQDGRSILTSSAGLQISFAARDIDEATRTSKMLGVQTLSYDNTLHQSEAKAQRSELVHGIMKGGDPFELNARLSHLSGARIHQSKERRPLRTADEVLNAPDGDAFLFVDGLRYPAIIERRNYWQQRKWAGRYHPNPYHPPSDKVQVQTLFGARWRRVVRAPVPEKYAHLPQYRDGLWSYIAR